MPRRPLAPTLLAALVLGCAPAAQPVTSSGPAAIAPTPAASGPAAPSSTPSSAAASPPIASPPAVAGPAAWARIDVSGPDAREDHTWTVDDAGAYAYLFGGREGATSLDDVWRYDLAADDWQRLRPDGRGPKARFGHGAAWVHDVGLVVWAGQAGSTFFDDLWAYDPETDRWRELPASGAIPEARYGSCAALGPDGRLWISHGFTDRGRFFDTRAYDFATGRWANETPGGQTPVERCLHDCLWTPDGRLVLYAGQTTGVPALGDLWAFAPEATAWTELQPEPRPAARQLYALATLGQTAWVHGGSAKDGDKLGDLWTLELATLAWRRIEPTGDAPSARSGASLIADPDRQRLLLFGGVGRGGERRDTWELIVPDPEG